MVVSSRLAVGTFVVVAYLAGCAWQGFNEAARESSTPPSSAAPAAVLPDYRGPAARPFLMGFTRWPADLTADGIATAQAFAHAHGDIVSVQLIGGIPWPEAQAGKPFSENVQENLNYRPAPGQKLFLSISPLDKDRRGLAPYWGTTDSQPLPKSWDNEPLNSSRVKRAYANFVLRAVERMRPDYLAIGVESNMLLSRDFNKWRQLKELHRSTYLAVKSVHKNLPIFFTTEVLHYKRLTRDSKGTEQEKEVAELMRYSDRFAMSIYPHMSPELPRPVPGNFFDFAKGFKKIIVVAESGMTSRDVVLKSYGTKLYGSDADQVQFTELLLKTAARDGYEFVINFATTDSDRLVARLRPPLNDLASIWAYTGMQTSDKALKPASAVWDGFYAAKYQPLTWW